MTQIQITSVKRYDANGYSEVSYKFSFTLPSVLGTGANPIENINQIVPLIIDGATTEVIPTTGTVIVVNRTEPVPTGTSLAQVKTALLARYNAIRATLDAYVLTPYDNALGLIYDGVTWGSSNGITDNPINQSNLNVSATAATGQQVVVTLPAIAGKVHNIQSISIVAYSTAARTGNATPITVSTSNLNSLAILFPTAAAIGTMVESKWENLKSVLSSTATTITCPATTGVIWRVNIIYSL